MNRTDDLIARVDELEEKVDSLETTRDRILGAISVISFLAPIAVTLLMHLFSGDALGLLSRLF
jgi:tetrahydromethanopterin S-methyltransferase subunit B